MSITFNQYFAICSEKPDEQRWGQWAFNVLALECPYLASRVPDYIDPFYSDAVLPEFYEWVERNW